MNDLQLYVTSFLPFCSDCLDFSLPYSVLLAREWNAKRMLSLSLSGLRDRIMADYEDYEDVVFQTSMNSLLNLKKRMNPIPI